MPTHAEDWHLKDWMRHFGKKQASLVNELGWDKARANFVFHSKQPYRRDVVNEIAGWLGIRPFELLLDPQEALAIRRLREAAAIIVGDNPARPEQPASLTKPRKTPATTAR